MSLARLAFTIGSAVSYWVAFTAPAQSAKTERAKQTLSELTLGVMVTLLFIPKVVCLIFAALETIATLSFYLADEHVPLIIHSFRGPYLPDTPSAIFATAGILSVLGAVIRVICYRTLGKFFTFNLSIRKSHALVTTGPYAYVRHPSYTGGYLAIIPAVVIHMLSDSWMQTSGLYAIPAVRITMWMWLTHTFICAVAVFGRMADEDKLLKQTFGKEWEDWATRVKYRLIPGVY